MIEREPEVENVWDSKKISLFFIAFILVAAAGIHFLGIDAKLMPYFTKPLPTSEVAGTNTGGFVFKDDKNPADSVKNAISDKIDQLKNQVINLDATEIASSSPQVKKILEDIKNLQSMPREQAKEACQKICSGF